MSRPSVAGRRAGLSCGRVVGKEYVRTVGAFLTNDVAAVRARGRLISIAVGVQYRPDAPGRQRSATIRRRAPCAFCRVTAVEAWRATIDSVPPWSFRVGVGAERRSVVRSGFGAADGTEAAPAITADRARVDVARRGRSRTEDRRARRTSRCARESKHSVRRSVRDAPSSPAVSPLSAAIGRRYQAVVAVGVGLSVTRRHRGAALDRRYAVRARSAPGQRQRSPRRHCRWPSLVVRL